MTRSQLGYAAVVLVTPTALVPPLAGGPEPAAPLLASDLPGAARRTGFLVCHVFSGLSFVLVAAIAHAPPASKPNRSMACRSAIQRHA